MYVNVYVLYADCMQIPFLPIQHTHSYVCINHEAYEFMNSSYLAACTCRLYL